MKIIDINTCFGFDCIDDADLSLETLCDMLDRNRVSKAFTFSRRGIYYHEQGNRETLEAVKKNSRLSPVATINPRDYFSSGNIIENLIEQGFYIFRFFPDEQGWPIDHFLPFTNILKKLNQYRIVVILPAMKGIGKITLIAEMMKEYSFPVILESQPGLAEIAAAMEINKRLFFGIHYFRACMKLEKIIEVMGADRLIFGSGAPVFMFESVFNIVKNADISEPDRDSILHGNISGLLEGLQ